MLSVYATHRGFGFILFRNAAWPLDWGTTDAKGKHPAESLKRIQELITQYEPDVLIVEDVTHSRRGIRATQFISKVAQLGARANISISRYSRSQIQQVFSLFSAKTKLEIAIKIASWLPQLAARMPPNRKPWMSEDSRMAIFDAAALALTHFYLKD